MGSGEVWGGEQGVLDELCDWHANIQVYLGEKEGDWTHTPPHYRPLIKAPSVHTHAQTSKNTQKEVRKHAPAHRL